MSRYFEIHITNGTPICSTYTIYHTSAVLGNVVTLYPSNTLATNITYSQLTSSPPLIIIAPDNATTILIKDTCGICTPYVDPIPARHFYSAVTESKTIDILSDDCACDYGNGNTCLVSGNGLTFCTSTQFYSNDFLSIQDYPTYLIYEGNKLLVTGKIGSFVVNVIGSDNQAAGCTPCDDKPTVFSGLVTTEKTFTFEAWAFPLGSYDPEFNVYGQKLNFDKVGIDPRYFVYFSQTGNLGSFYNQPFSYGKPLIFKYYMIFDVSRMRASGTTDGYSNDWQNEPPWREKTSFVIEDVQYSSTPHPEIGGNVQVENKSGTTIIAGKTNFPYVFNSPKTMRFTLVPLTKFYQWTRPSTQYPPPCYKYPITYYSNSGTVRVPRGPWNCNSNSIHSPSRYWPDWGTAKILPGSYVKIYDASQF
jgi:hypothetical protein